MRKVFTIMGGPDFLQRLEAIPPVIRVKPEERDLVEKLLHNQKFLDKLKARRPGVKRALPAVL